MISQTVEYALRAMSHLASHANEAANSETIARATSVPQGYLSKILRDLVRASLVKSYRGLHGGFSLARAPQTISLLDIVNAVDPIRRFDRCLPDNSLHTNLCALHRCLDDALAQIERTFRQTTLESVLSSDAVTDGCHSAFASSRKRGQRSCRAPRD